MMDCIHYPDLASHRDRYDGSTGVPLRIVLELQPGSRLVNYDPINLDNLLARAVVDEATGGRGLPNNEDGWYWLPVPLRLLWQSGDGLPLYAATSFRPVGDQSADIDYWHKRAQTGTFTRGRINLRNGRWMERRVPMPTMVCDTWMADAIGDPHEIARLLAPLGHVGKRRGSGYGEVRGWRVESIDAFQLTDGGTINRPLPADALELLDGLTPDTEPAPVGWTMPEWRPALFRPGWWTGTPVR